MLVYRIQPAGLGISHESEDSEGDSRWLHVFDSALAAIHCQECPTVYGDEVIEIETPKVWDNGDVEGVACNGHNSAITRRFELNEFAKFACPEVAKVDENEIEYTVGWSSCPHWYAARNL